MKFFITTIFLILNISCFSQLETLKKDFKKDRINIKYPYNWRNDSSKIMGTEFIILAPLENEIDKFSENVNVIIQDLKGQNIDINKYKEITDNQLTNFFNDCKVFESVILLKDNKEYFRITYSMTQGIFKLIITSICLINNDKAYLVTFSAEAISHEQYKSIGEEILSNFWLTN